MSHIYAIADLHLSFGVPDKSMALFGALWENHPERLREAWCATVQPEDIVLLAGDISWAMTLEEARKDLEWIAALPGTKVMIRGNHDYWWPSLKKLQSVLPPGLLAIHHNALRIKDFAICGTRFWDSPEYGFATLSGHKPEPLTPQDLTIYQRELGRLETSLKALDQSAPCKLLMTHYPPIGFDLAPSAASALCETYGVTHVVFGHLHALPGNQPYFGEARGVHYHLTAADALLFKPLLIV